MKGIALLFLGVLVAVCINSSLARSGLLDICQDGQTMEDSCNKCFCASGNWACTKIKCRGRRQVPGLECAEGDTKKDMCDNNCFCANGHWACTLKGCFIANDAPGCSPGDTKQVACNTCKCVGGDWACTKKICL